MVKIKDVEVTDVELDALEDVAVTWILCKKHNAFSGKDEVELFKMQNACKECNKLCRMKSSKALHLWSKLVHAYEIARRGKCACS